MGGYVRISVVVFSSSVLGRGYVLEEYGVQLVCSFMYLKT
jgi:hypothetical protein